MNSHQGFGLIEVLVGVTIIVVGILALNTAYTTYIKYALANQSNSQAAFLGEEAMEGTTFLRDKGWTSYIAPLSTTTTYYLNFTGGYWNLTSTAQPYVDSQFLRTIAITDVKRDSSTYNIVSTGGIYDPNTKQITSTISYYQGHATTTQTMSTYITNIYNN